MNRKVAFKGVVWPRQSKDVPPIVNEKGEKLYRYAVVGVIVTDKPFDPLEKVTKEFGRPTNTATLCGSAEGLLEALGEIPRGEPTYPLGDAVSVLSSLDSIKPNKG